MAITQQRQHEQRTMRLYKGAQPAYTAVIFVSVAAAFTVWPGLVTDPIVLVACAALVAMRLTIFVLPWRSHRARWFEAIAYVDIAALLALQLQGGVALPTLGFPMLIPAIWLGFVAPPRAIVVTTLAASAMAVLPRVLASTFPDGWAPRSELFSFPFIVLTVHLSIWLLSRLNRRSQQALVQLSTELGDALLENENRRTVKRVVLETVENAVCIVQPDGRLDLVNPAMAKLRERSGASGDEVLGPLVFAEDRETVSPLDCVTEACLGSGLRGRLVWIGEPGDQRAVLVSAGTARAENGTLLGTVVAASDVTELADALRIREEFLASVSHGLRTPLTSVVGYLDLVEEEAVEAGVDIEAPMSVVHRNLDELTARLGDLLSAAQSDIPIARAPVDLAEVVRRVAAGREDEARAGDVELAVTLTDEAVVIEGDRLRLAQAIDHLVANAIRFTPPGGLVSVALTLAEQQAVVSVWDTGCGIPVQERGQVFDRFFRGRAVRSANLPGMGLGLTIARAIATAHDGRIDVTSEVDEGSLFALALPVVAAAEPTLRVTPEHGTSTPASTRADFVI